MAPLSLEAYNPDKNSWITLDEIKPLDRPGSISDNRPDGERDIYLLECAPDDSHSTIYRSKLGVDVDLTSQIRSVTSASGLEVIKELKKGESFEMDVKTDRSSQPSRIRFTHK
ncbi:MAG: hypothetical protein AAB694_01460 [Patescibacteria group bacterium]